MIKHVFGRKNKKVSTICNTPVDFTFNGAENGCKVLNNYHSSSMDSKVKKKCLRSTTNVTTKQRNLQLVKRLSPYVTISGIIIAGALLINRASICVTKYV
jgi:hypothetical protein